MPDHKRPFIASTVAVFAKNDKSFLLIIRKKDPFKGMYAFPGGYLEVGKEDMYQTAIRELKEETGLSINKKDLQLIDVRSDPKRDPRGHVVDVGFFSTVPKKTKLGKNTDEKPLWVSINKLSSLDLAFDHKLFWKNVKAHLQKQHAAV